MTPEQMEERLKSEIPGADVIVNDLTGSQNHYEVRVAASAFKGKSRIDRQRLVMDIFGPELKSGEVHALTIQTMEKD